MFYAYLVSLTLISSLSLSWFAAAVGSVTTPAKQKVNNRFFRFDEESDSWVPVQLPYNLVTCINGNCTIVGSIQQEPQKKKAEDLKDDNNNAIRRKANNTEVSKKLIPLRKRVSLTKMSDASIWITGESGSIYERFWNGVQWVIAPHDLPPSEQPAKSVFFVNQTIFALSETGYLYQMQLVNRSQLVWTKIEALIDKSPRGDREPIKIRSGVVTKDWERIYFCTKNGTLIELVDIEPPMWVNHGQPPGADVAVIADAGTIKSNLVFTISSAGHLYEHDRNAKPPWKKHIWRDGPTTDTSLLPSRGCSTRGLRGASSTSLFFLNKEGKLVERCLNQRKWKWILVGSPEDQVLTSITPILEDESSDKFSVYLTTVSGSILEYQISKQTGAVQEQQIQESWINHIHPPHAKVARGVVGISHQFGRILFPLDDGRLAELHLSGYSGENSGPDHQVSTRKRTSLKYVWSILDAPETEGWNAEYCTEERGPSNCIIGVKEETKDFVSTRSMPRRRKRMQQNYLIPDASPINLEISLLEEHKLKGKGVNEVFHMRVMQEGRSFFMVSKNGVTFEYLYNDNVGIWLKHEHPTAMNGVVGSYNGSLLFFIDIQGALIIRERRDDELHWINCTAMEKGKEITGGPPWDRIHGTGKKYTENDAIYFISKKGRLLQFSVALRNYKWKDCKNPANTKIATIVDQELCWDKVVFVTGRNGRLYQYNTLSGLWHEHHQSQHLVLSGLPGTAMRPSMLSLKGSLFMISEEGGLVEYHWKPVYGWIWVEHGTPKEGVSIAGAPGPSFEGHQLFLLGSDGKVYLRYFGQEEWKWRDFGFPDLENSYVEKAIEEKLNHQKEEYTCPKTANVNNPEIICDPKVARTRPIRSAENTMIFELRDGRLAEMHRLKDSEWIWSKIIETPTSLCTENLWSATTS